MTHQERAVPGILIFGYGNPSRGDDAIGPLLIDQLEQNLAAEVRQNAGGIELLTDFQLQVEHALDLVGRHLVLFVDAHQDCPPPWRLARLSPSPDFSYSTHAISPASVLKVFADIHPGPPPPSFLLGIRGYAFELGEPLSASAQDNLMSALALVMELCANPHIASWSSISDV
jgi:hydrogenase maturation protease